MAGNAVTKVITVTKDKTPPDLKLDSIPTIVVQYSVSITGQTTPGARVKVNGFDATVASDGKFERTVQLSAGMNIIVVRASDSAGNVVETRVGIYYTSSFKPEAGGSGGYLGMPPSAWAAILVVAGIIMGLVLSPVLARLGWPKKKGPEEAVEDEELPETPPEEVEEGPLEEEAIEEESRPAEEAEKPPEDKREAMLRKAFEEGRISEDVYEENLRRLREKG